MDIELDNPVITKMAIHVVGEAGADFARHLPSTNVVHQEFFLDRITETIKGCKCSFLAASGVYSTLKSIKINNADFYQNSKDLADLFHQAITSQGAAVPGAFLLFEILNSGEKIYSIIKYEHDDVVHYQNEVGEDGNEKLTFELLETTFVKKPQAMQKSALIRFSHEESIIHAIDRSEPKGITKYFRTYLGAIRNFDDIELTERLSKVVDAFIQNAVKAEKLPKEIKRTYKSRLYEFAQSENAAFDHENIPLLLATIVGTTNDELVSIFQKELKRNKIDGEKFSLDKEKIKKPSKLRTRTADGIEINFNQAHIETRKYIKEGDIIRIDISNGLEEDADQLG